MSTKIYNGFRFRTSNLREIHKLICTFRKQLQPLIRAKITHFLANRAVDIIDDTAVRSRDYQESRKVSPLQTAWTELIDRRRALKSKGLRDPEVDFDFQVAIIPHFQSSTLGITYTEQEDWRKLWMRQPLIEEYKYWNNCDRPDTLTARQWARRAKVWDDAIGSDPVNMRSLGADCSPEYMAYPRPTEILQKIPSLEKRLRRVVTDELALVWMKDEANRNGEELTDRNWFQYFMKFQRWMKTPESAGPQKEKREELAKLIPAKITTEMLIGLKPTTSGACSTLTPLSAESS